MGQKQRESWIFTFSEKSEEDEEVVEVPEDLSSFSDEDLATLQGDLEATFGALLSGDLNEDAVAEMDVVSNGITRIREELESREERKAELSARRDRMASKLGISLSNEEESEEESSEEENASEEASADAEIEAASSATETVETEAVTASAPTAPLRIKKRGLNVPASEVARHAPDPDVPDGRSEVQVVVAPDVPNFPAGTYLSNLEGLTDAIHRRAKTLALPSGRATVATIKRDYDFILDREANPNKVWDVMKAASDPQNLVAAGGWCAPSEIIYDFFNVTCEDGMIDLPTVGIQRGGIRFPVSPSIADIFANPDSTWLWTEQDDIDALTGDPTKPCVRIPCPDFEEERLDCHGLCVTAGNLMDSAFPELIQNHLSLTMAAHRHVINQRIIAEVAAQSVVVSGAPDLTDCSIAVDLLEMIDLQAIDYREKFRMCDDAVLELVLPRWARGVLRADISKRTGQNELAVSTAQIAEWFSVRNVRVQFVSDWQVNNGGIGSTTPATSWPDNLEFLLYAAGTFIRGAGMDLDLGVIRDSTLNETNDHTAAWTEECNLVARVGHEGRRVIVPLCVGGCTGEQIDFCGAAD